MGPAMQGLLRHLPPYNQSFKPGEKKRWLAAFEAILDLDYPDPAPAPFDQGPCEECGTTWKANEVLPCPSCADEIFKPASVPSDAGESNADR
jgi:hypothetical protein